MNLTEIHQEIEQASERRTELWHILSQGHDPAAAAELKSLSERLDRLWDEERTLKAELRFGDRDHIAALKGVGPGRGILPSPPGADTFRKDLWRALRLETTTKEP
jgi:hypothetical protein